MHAFGGGITLTMIEAMEWAEVLQWWAEARALLSGPEPMED